MWHLRLLVPLLSIASTGKCAFKLAALEASCPAGLSCTSHVRGGSCFELCDSPTSWMEARERCHERSGRLVHITNRGLHMWLSSIATQLLKDKNGVWLGLNDWSVEEEFSWDAYDVDTRESKRSKVRSTFRSKDYKLSYTNWANGYPRNDRSGGKCVSMNRRDNWRWTTNSCWGPFSFRCGYICEYHVTSTLNDAGHHFAYSSSASAENGIWSDAAETHDTEASIVRSSRLDAPSANESSGHSSATAQAASSPMITDRDVKPLGYKIATGIYVFIIISVFFILFGIITKAIFIAQEKSRPPTGKITEHSCPLSPQDERPLSSTPLLP